MEHDQFEILDPSLATREALLEMQLKCLRQQQRARRHLPPGKALVVYAQPRADGQVALTLLDLYGVAVRYVMDRELPLHELTAVLARHSAWSAGITRRN